MDAMMKSSLMDAMMKSSVMDAMMMKVFVNLTLRFTILLFFLLFSARICLCNSRASDREVLRKHALLPHLQSREQNHSRHSVAMHKVPIRPVGLAASEASTGGDYRSGKV
jgi:hypothetical protein